MDITDRERKLMLTAWIGADDYHTGWHDEQTFDEWCEREENNKTIEEILTTTVRGFDMNFVSNGGDAGYVFTARCPECRHEMVVCSDDWEPPRKCKCGYAWSLVLHAEGEKE